MHNQIFVNLPVADLTASKAFFARLGFTFNPAFTDEKAACMIIGENIYAMLLTRSYFQGFIDRPVADPAAAAQVLLALPCEDRAAVDAIVAKAVAAGGKAPRQARDYGFMYQHSFDDLDGHIWEVFYMDMDALPEDMKAKMGQAGR